jgi:hypothetical protein
MAEKTVTGILHSITDGSFYFETDDGQTIILVFDAEHRTPIQRKIALSIWQVFQSHIHPRPAGSPDQQETRGAVPQSVRQCQ